MKSFFENSDFLDLMVLRPLSHIRPDWELSWYSASEEYKPESDSFAYELNMLIEEMGECCIPDNYHDNEDIVVKRTRDFENSGIYKQGRIWIGRSYQILLQDGGFYDESARNLVLAAAGRVEVARRFGQDHFDDMEEAHQRKLAIIMALILYHRYT
jgi:hypothetical protein